MAEVFGFDKDGVRRTAETNRRVLGTLPPVGRRTRRIYTGNTSTGGGGGTGGGGCSCCDCTQCLNICDQNSLDVIQTCSACTTAPRKYTINLGSVLGTRDFNYVSGCTWETDNFTVYYTYPTGAGGSTASVVKGTLVEAGTSSTLVVSFVSGTNTMKLGEARQLSWKPDPDKSWSCICNMTMIPSVSPEKFPPNLFVPCEACVAPADSPPRSSDCTYLNDRGWCLESVTTTAVDLSGSGGVTDCTSGTITESPLTATGADEPCCYDLSGDGGFLGYLAYACSPSGAYLHVRVHVCVNSTTGVLSALVTLEEGFTAALYIFTGTYVTSGAAALGANVLTFVSSTAVTTAGGGAITDGSWPASITVNISRCSFEDTNVDYGYGCGGGSTDCSGLCPAVSAVGVSPTGFVWTFTGADPSNCVGASCICQTIDQITALFGYPESLGVTAGAPCVNS